MTLPAQYTYRDYLAALRLHRTSWFGTLFWLAYAGFVLWRQFLSPDAHPSWDPKTFAIAILLFALLCLIQDLLLRRRFQEDPTLQNLRSIEITHEGFTLHTDRLPVTYLWKDFTKVRRDKAVTLVYRKDVLYQIFPRRWFTDEQYAEFETILKASLGAPSR